MILSVSLKDLAQERAKKEAIFMQGMQTSLRKKLSQFRNSKTIKPPSRKTAFNGKE